MAGLVVYMCGTAGQTRQRRPACCGGSVHVHVLVLVLDPETQPNREGYPQRSTDSPTWSRWSSGRTSVGGVESRLYE